MTNTPFPLLNESVRTIASASDETRIDHLKRDLWIPYSLSRRYLKQMEQLVSAPRVSRPPSFLIFGDTNNGKTELAKTFLKRFPRKERKKEEGPEIQVLLIEAPTKPDEVRFFNEILWKIGAKFRANDHVSAKEFQAIELMRKINLRVLVIDEVHNILAGRTARQRHFLSVLRHLSNELGISIVALGTVDAHAAITSDPQLANRFDLAPLPRWRLDREFLKLLVNFETMLPLRKPSKLASAELANLIFAATQGTIGEIKRYLSLAAIKAVEDGTERIDAVLLGRLEWIRPSERKRAADALRAST